MRLGILVAAVVLTAGCGGGSGDDPGSTEPGTVTPGSGPTPGPVESTTPIAFSAQQQDEQDVTRAGEAAEGGTRAAGLQTLLPADDKTFKVWGYKTMSDGTTLQTVFPGYTVNYVSAAHSTTTNSNGWEYVNQGHGEQTIKYWDWSVRNYRFFGVAPATAIQPANVTETIEEVKISIQADATTDANNYYSRLWYSDGTQEYPNRQFGQPVQLEFVKPVARVRFSYKYVSPRDGVSIGTQTFKPTDKTERIIRKGTVLVTYPLTGAGTQESTTITDIANELEGGFTKPDTWYTVLPNTEQGSFTLTVDINGITKYATVPAEYMHWQAGYSYTYIFKINADGGVDIGWVDYAVTPWTEMVADRTVYNW
ncbi:MAG: hypothetical protein IJ929_00220 [Prevotella sp.]|nr:hypothetical protein [Prevotella sp.]